MKNMKEPKKLTHEELISLEEELALINQIQQSTDNCEAVKEKLAHTNLRIVSVVAKKYASPLHPVEKLIHEGNKGLLLAASKYDMVHGFKFTSYAIWWINESIKQYINNSK